MRLEGRPIRGGPSRLAIDRGAWAREHDGVDDDAVTGKPEQATDTRPRIGDSSTENGRMAWSW